MDHEAAVPAIDRDELVRELKRSLPDMDISSRTINADYGSWEIDVRGLGCWVNITWGPLSGFGATDMDNIREDNSPFLSHDWPLETAAEAVAFAVRVLTGGVAPPALKSRGQRPRGVVGGPNFGPAGTDQSQTERRHSRASATTGRGFTGIDGDVGGRRAGRGPK
jgi:hypothetical protein